MSLGGNNKGLAIVRISSLRQEGNTSHETQESEIRAYCERNGIRLVETVRIIESAKDSDDRKKYSKAISRALEDDLRHVLFYMYDREARNLTDSEKNEKLVRSGLITLHYVREGKVLHQDSPDSDFFIRDIQAATSKQFIRTLRAKVTDAMRQKAESGWYPSNSLPMGYKTEPLKDASGRPRSRGAIVVVDPATAPVVRREFELRAEGHSYEQIRARIRSEGILPPKRDRGYTAAAIERRIHSPFYIGSFYWQGLLYPGKHELIVPPDLARRAREMRRARKNPRHTAGHGALGGAWIRCAECGCGIVYDPKRKVYRSGKTTVYHYYRCNNTKRAHASMAGLNVPEAWLWEQLGRALQRLTLSEDLAQKIADALNESHAGVLREAAKRIQAAKASLSKLAERELRVDDALLDGTLDREGFQRQRERIKQERERLQREIDEAQSVSRAGYRETAQSMFELCRSAKSLFDSRSGEERRDLIQKVISNLRLNGTTLEYDYRSAFKVLVEMSESEDWRARVVELRTLLSGLQWGKVA